ncbi:MULTISPECIES: cytochrome c-type biogenesis protein CcmH [unclassified Shewanella]|uniref:cytochrome c-type biogenesis protein n=1 Tax=unclassified Shewanella TaxID=196818 RepID=UPI001F53A46A|nr:MULTISPECIES: cytochrome c-type biogenesis protein CcmH [unclassified Shewanella]MDO6619400.1 cytochrome c-type biogenesis protein CcmH [Shewanella sp. 6_MG-2023]MDO6775319.1 cytochrome c-type biogenesis protein CcmH [Shewanella sp. 3_MG-2023]
MTPFYRMLHRMFSPISVAILTVLLIFSVQNVTASEALSHRNYSADEKRQLGFEIAQELRCPASDNRSLFDSETQIANELKGHIFQKLDQGQSKQEIIDFMVARFGERIRYQPSLHSGTLALWLIPIGLFFFTIIGGIAWIIKQPQTPIKLHLNENEYE